MAEKGAEQRMNSPKSSTLDKSTMMKKKSRAELEQEAHMAQQYATVIGELKAAEARNRSVSLLVVSFGSPRFSLSFRIRATRLRFSKSHRDEIDQIIAFQPNALSALRFEAFMTDPSSSFSASSSQKEKLGPTSLHSSPRSTVSTHPSKDPLTQIERRRVQNLLLDEQNLLVNRVE